MTSTPRSESPRRPGRPDPDRTIDTIASRQHGIVTRSQLLKAGVPEDLIDRRVRNDRVHPVHRGVYRVGPVISGRAREMAAALACGDHAFVSHQSAAWLWALAVRPPDGAVQVTVARGRVRPRAGIRAWHMRTLRADECTVCDLVPVTTPARTLLDVAAVAPQRDLEHALAEAFALRLTTPGDVLDLARRHPYQPGLRRLLDLLAHDTAAARTRSEAEARFLALVRAARLPAPATNVHVAGVEVDFLWRAERLVIEVDGRAFHGSDLRFESDRRRDAALVAAGLRVMRVTWRQIVDEPESLLVRVAQALVRTGPLAAAGGS